MSPFDLHPSQSHRTPAPRGTGRTGGRGPVAAAPAPPPGRAAVNRAVASLLAPAPSASAGVSARALSRSSPVLQRMWDLEWSTSTEAQKLERNTVGGPTPQQQYTGVAKSALSAALQAGLTLAQANADALPTPLPAWLDVQVPEYNGAVPKQTKQNKPVMKAMFNTDKKKLYKKQWGATHANNGGLLPGVVGAGGYKEYYAEPEPDAVGYWNASAANRLQPLGKNRILKQTNASAAYWWASSDHYTTYRFITDA